MNLVVVESPTKAKTLDKFLGREFEVAASYGHVRDLPENKLGVEVEADFEPLYIQNEKQKQRVKEITKLAERASKVYLATDPDREGEAIAWHVAQLLEGQGLAGERIKRVEFHEITRVAVERALANPREIDLQLVDAQQARRVLDRLVGYKLSPLLWRKVRRGLSAGRVQSVAVRLVVEREKEIEAFVEQEYWRVWVKLRGGEGCLWLEAVRKNGEKLNLTNKLEAEKVARDLEKAEFRVVGVEKKEFARTPPPPFTTSTLQQTAANRFGWSAKRTMQVAQALYERGLITYHRTDSLNVAVEAAIEAGNLARQEYGKDYALERPRFYKTANKSAQEAHEAIRPTQVGNGQAAGVENKDQEKLYELIWKRFVATQMADAKGESVKIKVEGNGEGYKYELEAKGETIIFAGWQKLQERNGETPDEDGEAEPKQRQLLPELKPGEKLELAEIKEEQKFTQPPPRYNDASLIKKLEEMGIGRPSTYAPILSTIVERHYVEKVDKRYAPTAIGKAVNEFLLANFGEIVDYQFTAKMEEELDEIAEGKRRWREVMREFYEPFACKLQAMEQAPRVKIEIEATGQKCPECGQGEVVVRTGRYGKFLSCSRYPECGFTAKFENKTGQKCPECGQGEVVVKRTRTGRTFYGCERYPDCRFASWKRVG